MSNAKNVNLDCEGTSDICEQDCYAILCLGAPSVLQRLRPEQRAGQYRASGAAQQPFGNGENMDRMGTARPPTPEGAEPYRSAEEWPSESTWQGGSTTYLFPVTNAQQSTQGRSFRALYRAAGIRPGDWFNVNSFSNANGPYCTALNQEPPDRSVCHKDLPTSILDWGKYVFTRVQISPIKFRYVGKSLLSIFSRSQHNGTSVVDGLLD